MEVCPVLFAIPAISASQMPLIFSEAPIVVKQGYLIPFFKKKNVFNEQNLKADLTELCFSFCFLF